MNISKVVIPAAGLGTRFLPYTKAVSKEMLPVGNKPAIQFIIEEALQSDIKKACLIINEDKKDIVNYFSPNPKLNAQLALTNKASLLDPVNNVMQAMSFTYINQDEPRGLGHAILTAAQEIGNDYFGVMLPDDLMMGQPAALGQLIEQAKKNNGSVFAVQEVPKESVASYGIIAYRPTHDPSLFEVTDLVEKPAPEKAPSNLAIIGRYVLSPKIFDSLNTLNAQPRKGELQLTDAISHMMKHHGQKVYAYIVRNTTRYDLGTPPGWLKAVNGILK